MTPLHEITNEFAMIEESFRKSPSSRKRRSSITFELAKIPKPKLYKEDRNMEGKKSYIPHPEHRSTTLRWSPRSKLPPPRQTSSSKSESATSETDASDEHSVVKPLAKCKRIQNALRILQNSLKRPSTSPVTSRTFLDVMRDSELEERNKLEDIKSEIEMQNKTNQKLKRKLQEERELELHCIRQSRLWRDERDQVIQGYESRKHNDDMEVSSLREQVKQELSALYITQQEARKQLVSNFDNEIKQAEQHHDKDAFRDITEYKELIVKYTEQLDTSNKTRMEDMAKEEAKFEAQWTEAQKYRQEEYVEIEKTLQERKSQLSQISDVISQIQLEIESADSTQLKKELSEKDIELREIINREQDLKSQIKQQDLEYEELKQMHASIQPVIEDAQYKYDAASAKLQELQTQIRFLNNSIYNIEKKVRVFIRSPSSMLKFDQHFDLHTSNQEILLEFACQVSMALEGNHSSHLFVGDKSPNGIFWEAVKYALDEIPESKSITARFTTAGDQFYHDLLDNNAVIDSIGEAQLITVNNNDLFLKHCQAKVDEKFQVPLVIQILVGKGKLTFVQLSGTMEAQLEYLNQSMDLLSTCVASTLNSLYDNSICLVMGDFSCSESENTLDQALVHINRHVSGYNAIS